MRKANDLYSDDLLELIETLKQNIKRELRVASLCVIKSVDEDKKTAIVSLFPILNTEKSEEETVRYFNDTPVIGSIGLVVFADRNFIRNLDSYKWSGTIVIDKYKVENNNFHSSKFGILVKLQ